jgi:hypothetical protein
MLCRQPVVILSTLLVLASVASGNASDTPQALYGKSLVVRWTETRNQTYPDGTQTHPVVQTAFTI